MKCEGCGAKATCRDTEDIPLCDKCAKATDHLNAIFDLGATCKLCGLATAKVLAMMDSKTRWGCIKLGCPVMHVRSNDYRKAPSVPKGIDNHLAAPGKPK